MPTRLLLAFAAVHALHARAVGGRRTGRRSRRTGRRPRPRPSAAARGARGIIDDPAAAKHTPRRRRARSAGHRRVPRGGRPEEEDGPERRRRSTRPKRPAAGGRPGREGHVAPPSTSGDGILNAARGAGNVDASQPESAKAQAAASWRPAGQTRCLMAAGT